MWFKQDYRHEICERYFREICSHLSDKPTRFHLVDEDFAIDNTVVDSKLEELKRKIVEVASQQPYWGEQIPARWLSLEQELIRCKAAGRKVISRNDVENLNKEGAVPIEKSEELDLFLRFLHETSTIIYFNIEVLRENIVLDPVWLIDALRSLINAQPNQPINPADSGAQSDNPADRDADSSATQKWSDFKEKGKLTLELVETCGLARLAILHHDSELKFTMAINDDHSNHMQKDIFTTDAVWTKENNPDLHD